MSPVAAGVTVGHGNIGKAKALVHVWRLGRLRYQCALRLQLALADKLKDKQNSSSNSHTLLLLEHHPVYTTGIRTHEYSAQEEARLRSIGADFHRADRGGLITFHGPGQLVAYPILNLRSFVPEKASRKALLGMKWYIHQLEEAVIATCDSLGLAGAHRSPHTGVWLGGKGQGGEPEKKVCAMGVHNSGFVTTHGLAINCNTDLVRILRYLMD